MTVSTGRMVARGTPSSPITVLGCVTVAAVRAGISRTRNCTVQGRLNKEMAAAAPTVAEATAAIFTGWGILTGLTVRETPSSAHTRG
jgi:hypothetical protein